VGCERFGLRGNCYQNCYRSLKVYPRSCCADAHRNGAEQLWGEQGTWRRQPAHARGSGPAQPRTR